MNEMTNNERNDNLSENLNNLPRRSLLSPKKGRYRRYVVRKAFS